jgi:CRISPR-associated protein Csd1
MSWMQRLYQTYDHIRNLEDAKSLWPIAHFVKNAHIELVISDGGNLKRVSLLQGKEASTLIPASESSAGRSGSKIAPHPLSDEIGYCAVDYPEIESERYQAYYKQLMDWCNSAHSHPKLKAIKSYLDKNCLWTDLQNNAIEFPLTFKNASGQQSKIPPNKVFIRWRVETKLENYTGTWEDQDLIEAWIKYDTERNTTQGFCTINGAETRTANNHPRFIRHSGDGGKLISSNDSSGFTFRGKFLDENQAYGIGFDVTQKAHNALRWLIHRQGVKNGDQVIVAWAISGKKIPNPVADPFDFDDDDDLSIIEASPDNQADKNTDNLNLSSNLGQRVALKLKLKIKGYQQALGKTEQLSIMAIDSATPGRMGVTYYQECLSEAYFSNLNAWYENFSWYQRYSKEISQPTGKKPKAQVIWPIAPPAPYVIAQAAYGKTLTDTLKKNIYARILPCIAEGCAFPVDVVNLCVARACNPNSGEHWEWERNVGVACALYRGYFSRHPKLESRRNFSMALDITNQSRDYLYGRLLAVAEEIEHLALKVGGEKRSTTAERFMQQFADRPFSTWRNIELALRPYMERLRNNRAGFLNNRQKELTDIMNLFDAEKFSDDKKLTGEFLLGYHCQKMTYRKGKSENTELENASEE